MEGQSPPTKSLGLPVLLNCCSRRATWEGLTVSGVRVVAADGVFSPLLFHLQQKVRRDIIFPAIGGILGSHSHAEKGHGLASPAAPSFSTHPQCQRLAKEALGNLRQTEVCPLVSEDRREASGHRWEGDNDHSSPSSHSLK